MLKVETFFRFFFGPSAFNAAFDLINDIIVLYTRISLGLSADFSSHHTHSIHTIFNMIDPKSTDGSYCVCGLTHSTYIFAAFAHLSYVFILMFVLCKKYHFRSGLLFYVHIFNTARSFSSRKMWQKSMKKKPEFLPGKQVSNDTYCVNVIRLA